MVTGLVIALIVMHCLGSCMAAYIVYNKSEYPQQSWWLDKWGRPEGDLVQLPNFN
jgi:hypothetical protein